MSGSIKVCGERGLVTFCPTCQDWEPFKLRPVPGGGLGAPALCQRCYGQLPKVHSLPSRAEPAAAEPEEFRAAAGEADASGDPIMAGILRVQAANLEEASEEEIRRHNEMAERVNSTPLGPRPSFARPSPTQRFNVWWSKHRPGSVAGRELALDAFLAGAEEES
jgi:hypothetical protein